MKINIMKARIFWTALAMAAVLGCNKPEDVQAPADAGDDGPDTPPAAALTAPVLTASVSTVTLDRESDEAAIKLTWTSAGDDASYKLEAGTATPAVYNVAGLEKTLSHRDLASLGDAPFTVVFKVKAYADGKSDVWSNSVSVSVEGDSTPPEPPTPTYPSRLYIYFWAWSDATHAQEMTKVSDGVFSWTGDCSPWEFKFLTANAVSDDYGTGYSRDETATEYWTMKPTVSGSDATFQLAHDGETAGNFTITADLTTMKVSYVRNETPLPEHLYVDTWGWGDGTKAKEMTALGDGKFTWSGVLPCYNVKFTTSNTAPDDYWTGYFRDPDADYYWTLKETSEQVMFNPADCGFRDGYVTLNVDLNTLKAELIPHVWIIGSGVDAGWTLANAEEMTWQGDGVFTWTGQMYAHENDGTDKIFKFLVVNDGWYGYWRNSTETDYWVAGVNDQGDQQFSINHDNLPDGIYTVTLNIFTGAVSVEPVTTTD